jgi:hypothetical protein
MHWSIAPTDEFVGVWIPRRVRGCLDSLDSRGCLDSLQNHVDRFHPGIDSNGRSIALTGQILDASWGGQKRPLTVDVLRLALSEEKVAPGAAERFTSDFWGRQVSRGAFGDHLPGMLAAARH